MNSEHSTLMEEARMVDHLQDSEGGNSRRWKLLSAGLGLVLGAALLYPKIAPAAATINKGEATTGLMVKDAFGGPFDEAEKVIYPDLGDANFIQLGYGSCSLDICGCFPTFVDFQGPLCDATKACLKDPKCIGLDHSPDGTARLYYSSNPPSTKGLVTSGTCNATDFNIAARGCARGCDQAPVCLKKVCSLLYSDTSCAAALGAGFQLRPDAGRRTGGALDCCKCAAGLTSCDGSCVNVDNNSKYCGDCNTRCRADQICAGGLCKCPPGQEECFGKCVAVDSFLTDRFNCGQCGRPCLVAGQVCVNGFCQCDGDSFLCNGECKSQGDFNTDPSNCGYCNNVCRAPTNVCLGGSCKCPPGKELCGEACVDVTSDSNNCGSCNTQCNSATHVCLAGECIAKPGTNQKVCGCKEQCSTHVTCLDSNGVRADTPCDGDAICSGTGTRTLTSPTPAAIKALCKAWTPLVTQDVTCSFDALTGQPNPNYEQPGTLCSMTMQPFGVGSPKQVMNTLNFQSTTNGKKVTGSRYMMFAKWRVCESVADGPCTDGQKELNICWTQSSKPTNSIGDFDGLNQDAALAATTPSSPATLQFNGESSPNPKDLLCYFNGAPNNNPANPSWNCMGQTTFEGVLAQKGIRGPTGLYASSVKWFLNPDPLGNAVQNT